MKIFITLFMILVLILSFTLEVDEIAKELQDEAFDRALISFGLAKGLNAVISLLQGTQLSFTPVGVGLNFSVGEVLDPFNDMVERFSWVMLGATVSIGIQKIILTLSATLFMQVALLISVSFSIFLLWSKSIKLQVGAAFVAKSFLLLVLLRFSAIVFTYTLSFMHVNILEIDYNQASQVIENTKVQLDNLNEKNQTLAKAQKEDGFFSGLSSKYNAVLEKLNISQQLKSLDGSIEEASNNIITLITIFIVETLLMPLLYFWLMLSSIKYIFRVKFDMFHKKLLYNKTNLNKEGSV